MSNRTFAIPQSGLATALAAFVLILTMAFAARAQSSGSNAVDCAAGQTNAQCCATIPGDGQCGCITAGTAPNTFTTCARKVITSNRGNSNNQTRSPGSSGVQIQQSPNQSLSQ